MRVVLIIHSPNESEARRGEYDIFWFKKGGYIWQITKNWIGVDNLAHYQDGTIQPISKNSTVKGYSTKGITERILSQLKTDLPLDEMCEEHEVEVADIRDSIEYALEELEIC